MDLYADVQVKQGEHWRRIDAGTARVANAGDIVRGISDSSSLSAAAISELLGDDGRAAVDETS